MDELTDKIIFMIQYLSLYMFGILFKVLLIAQSSPLESVEYADCIPAEVWGPPLLWWWGPQTKQPDSEASVMNLSGKWT